MSEPSPAASDRRAKRAAARRRRAADDVAAHADDYAELVDALGHWLTPKRVDALGAQVATYVAKYRRANRSSPGWGQTLTGSGVMDAVPFAPPDELASAARQKWRNVGFGAVMQACRARGWVDYGKRQRELIPGRRFAEAVRAAQAARSQPAAQVRR